MTEGFTKGGRAVISILAGIGTVVSLTMVILSALGLLRLGSADAKALPLAPGVATAEKLEAVAQAVAELKSDVRAYLVRVNVLEQWKARQEGIEEQRARDARAK